MTTRKDNCTAAHQEGVDAAHSKKPDQAMCPYKAGKLAELWNDGYDCAKRAIIRAAIRSDD